jgi:hypothetical protein
MIRLFAVLAIALVLVGCERDAPAGDEGEATMSLTITWQRLVTDDGETCDRCGGTQEEFRKAVETLRESLRPLGMEVVAVEDALTPEEFAAHTIESNRILIEGRPLEDWLGGETGQSECESCCSAIGENVECRTVNVDGTTYETIPAELIVRAGLLAASGVMEPPASGTCCPGASQDRETGTTCCPESGDDEGATS